ncbi:MAG: hypothetical protein ACJATT_003758 [Myxococcota bacterium]|jgi:hypothetical protein
MDAYTAPETTHSGPRPASIRARVLAVFCLILGILGTLMTCFSAFSVIWSQVAPSFMDPAQAEVMRVIHAQQGWWVLPFSLLQLLAKMTLSVGLIAGSTLVIAHKPSGPNLLRPVLIYGIILELGVGLLGTPHSTSPQWRTSSAKPWPPPPTCHRTSTSRLAPYSAP